MADIANKTESWNGHTLGEVESHIKSRLNTDESIVGFYTCGTAAETVVKVVSASNYVLTDGGSIKIKFTYANSVASPILNINSTGAKAIVYNGAVASATNTWKAGDVVEFYYDPTYNSNVGAYIGIPTVVATPAEVSQLGQQMIYDVTKNNPTAGPNNDGKFESLSALLLDANLSTLIPSAIRCGGMSIRFVQTSDNKYVQYRLMYDDWSINETDWQGVDDEPTANSDNLVKSGGVASMYGSYIEDAEFIYIKADSEEKILFAIRNDGKLYFGAGIPEQIVDYVEEQIEGLNLDEIRNFIGNLITDNTLQSLLDTKVDKVAGKKLSSNDFTDAIKEVTDMTTLEDDPSYMKIWADSEDHIILAIDENGGIYFGVGVPPQIKDYVEREIDGLNIDEISTFLGELVSGGFTLQQLLDAKVDKSSTGNIKVTLDIEEKTVTILSKLSQNYDIENSMYWNDETSFSKNPCTNYGGTYIIDSNDTRTKVNTEYDNISATDTHLGWIGANHGAYRLSRVAAPSHGKTYADIGSRWSDANFDRWILVQIIDANNLGFVPMYYIQDGLKKFYEIIVQSGTMIHVENATNTDSITVDSATLTHWYPSEHIISRGFYLDGKELVESGTYYGNDFDLIEVYDILSPSDFLDVIIAWVGTFTKNPLPKDYLNSIGTLIRYSNDYRFSKEGLNVLFIDWIVMSEIGFTKFFPLDVKAMVSNALGGELQYYLPKALPITENGVLYDFRIPTALTRVAGNNLNWTSEYWEVPLLPPDRAIMFITDGTNRIIGLHHGYVFDQGVASGFNRKDYCNSAWWIYENITSYTGAIDTKVGDRLQKGVHYGIVSYRKYEDYTDNPRGLISLSHFKVNDRYYVYADFEAAGEYELEIPKEWNGKELTVFEKSNNVELLSSLAVSPILAVVSSATPMYGYVVFKIN